MTQKQLPITFFRNTHLLLFFSKHHKKTPAVNSLREFLRFRGFFTRFLFLRTAFDRFNGIYRCIYNNELFISSFGLGVVSSGIYQVLHDLSRVHAFTGMVVQKPNLILTEMRIERLMCVIRNVSSNIIFSLNNYWNLWLSLIYILLLPTLVKVSHALVGTHTRWGIERIANV